MKMMDYAGEIQNGHQPGHRLIFTRQKQFTGKRTAKTITLLIVKIYC